MSTSSTLIQHNEAVNLLALAALQGLVNRAGPKLYLDTLTLNPWSCDPSGDGAAMRWDREWLRLYERRGLRARATTDLSNLLLSYRSAVRGLVLHDPSKWWQISLAFTLTCVREPMR